MAEWEGKSLGTPTGYGFFIFLMKYFGLYPAYYFLYIVVLYYFLFSVKTSGYIYNFYRKGMGFGAFKSILKIYRNYYLLGQMLIDKVAVMAGFSNKFTSESFGAENLKTMVAQNKGGILLGAHLGNWEIAGHYIMNYDKRINIVIYDAEHQQIKDYLESVTGGKKFNVIAIKDDLSHVYAIGDALQRNELICMHADRFIQGHRTRGINFLGQQAQFPVGPFQIIKSFKAPYTFVYGIKRKTTHYNFFARPIRYVGPETTIETMMKDYVADLEGMVKQYPAQWFNYFDFWKNLKCMMPISGDELQALIPQKPPFVMVDKLIATNGVKCTTSFSILAANLLCDNGRLNPSGMIENIAQSAALMLGYSAKSESKTGPIGYIADIRNFTYTKQPDVGMEITTEVNLTHEVLDVKIISGIIRLADEEIASCTIKIFQAAKTD